MITHKHSRNLFLAALLAVPLFVAPGSCSSEEEADVVASKKLTHSPRKVHFFDTNKHSYNRDLHDLMAKMHFSGKVFIVNNLKQWTAIEIDCDHPEAHKRPSILHILTHPLESLEELLGVDTKHDKNPQQANISVGGTMVIQDYVPYPGTMIRVTKPGKAFLNVVEARPDLFRLSIDPAQLPVYPRPVAAFDFTPRFFEPLTELPAWVMQDPSKIGCLHPQYCHHGQGHTATTFEKEFDSHLVTMAYVIAPQEGIAEVCDIYKKRATLSNLFTYNPLIYVPVELPRNRQPRIPLISHKFWLTNPAKPVEFPQQYLLWAQKSMDVMPLKDGWKHYLWVQNKALLPKTVKKLASERFVIMEIYKDAACTELNTDALPKFGIRKLFEDALSKNKFGMASDICRLAALKVHGGFYYDTDYIVAQNPYLMMYWYDSFFGIEPMSTFLCNAFMAARPNHPIIKKALKLIARNFDPAEAPDYILDTPLDDGYLTVAATGPVVTTLAFHFAAGENDNRDIAFPPSVLYPPKIEGVYPQKDVKHEGDPLPQESLGHHEWETSWAATSKAGKEFGSKG